MPDVGGSQHGTRPGQAPLCMGDELTADARHAALACASTTSARPDDATALSTAGRRWLRMLEAPNARIATTPSARDLQTPPTAIEGALCQVMSIYATRLMDIRLYLLPSGIGFRAQDASLQTARPRLSLVVPHGFRSSNNAGKHRRSVSHESFHLMGYLSGDERAADERSAYGMGVCSQLIGRSAVGHHGGWCDRDAEPCNGSIFCRCSHCATRNSALPVWRRGSQGDLRRYSDAKTAELFFLG